MEEIHYWGNLESPEFYIWAIINHNSKFILLTNSFFGNKEEIIIIIYNLLSSNDVRRKKIQWKNINKHPWWDAWGKVMKETLYFVPDSII